MRAIAALEGQAPVGFRCAGLCLPPLCFLAASDGWNSPKASHFSGRPLSTAETLPTGQWPRQLHTLDVVPITRAVWRAVVGYWAATAWYSSSRPAISAFTDTISVAR